MRLQKITSRENQRLIHARKVRDGKERDLIFIEGRRLAVEALRSEINIHRCFIVEGFRDQEVMEALTELRSDFFELPAPLFRSIAATQQPQGVILLAERPVGTLLFHRWTEARVPIFLFLEEVNNPSNLGAILRSVEAAGAAGVFVSSKSADIFSAKALRASMGAAFRVPVRVNMELLDAIREASSSGVVCLAVDASAERSYVDVDWKKPHLLICGSEAHGLSADHMKLIGGSIAIPMETKVESLNLSVAASIVMFEGRRQIISRLPIISSS